MSTCLATAARTDSLRRCALVLVWFTILSFCSLWLLASKTYGQAEPKYDVMEYQPTWFTDKSIVSKIKQIRGQIIGDATQLDAQRTFFVQIYDNIFASMTDPATLDRIAENRALIMKDIDNANRRGNPRVARGLTLLAFNKCLEIAKGNYHPTARINAVLMMGELNEREMNSLKREAPIALKNAFDPLLEFISGAEYNDGIRVAALQGLKRHTALNKDLWQPAEQDKVADLLISLAESDSPTGRQREAHGWMQAMAIDLLLVLNNPRRADKVASVVIDMATKSEASDYILVHAAKVSPALELPNNVTPKTDVVVERWARQMAASIGKEARRLEHRERERPKVSAMSGGVDAGDLMYENDAADSGQQDEEMYGAPAGGPVEQTPEIVRARRMLNYVLESFHLGLSGSREPVDDASISKGLVAVTADADQKARAQQLLQLVDLAIEKVNDDTIGKNLDYAEHLRTVEAELRKFVNPNAAAPEKSNSQPIPFSFPGGEPFGTLERPSSDSSVVLAS